MSFFSLQEMVQQTLAEADRRVKLASADAVADGEEKSPTKAGPSAKNTPPVNPNTAPERNEASIEEKTASPAHIETSFVQKLASAVAFCNEHLDFEKVAVGEVMPPPPDTMPKATENVGAGKGPNKLETNLESPTPGVQNDQFGQATSQNVVPMKTGPATASEPGNTAPATSIDNDYDKVPGGSENWKDKDVLKQASAELDRRAGRGTRAKTASSTSQVARIMGIMNKTAADVSPDASASEEGVPALPGPAAAQARFVGSNEAARDYTKRDAKAEPKERMGEVLSEPAQVKSTDPVLQNNLSETSEAGTKISSAQPKPVVKTAAAARALLEKIASEGGPQAMELKKLLSKKTSEGVVGQQGAAAMPIGGGF